MRAINTVRFVRNPLMPGGASFFCLLSLKLFCSCLPRVALVLTFVFGAAAAEPQGGRIVGGEGSIRTGKDTVVEQGSRDLVVDWDRFDVGANESVHFAQKSAAYSVLNRIYDHKPSEVLGRLTARGKVWLLNPNGVFFGRGARVSVGSLVAAGLWMEKEDFLAGRYVLSRRGEAAGAVRNRGVLEASGGGIGLAGGTAVNEGELRARQGRVTLAAVERIAVDFDGDGLLRFALAEGAANGAVRNDGTVEGNEVNLGLQEARGVFRGVVNNGGAVQAVALEERGGAVSLVGASVKHTGRIAAQGVETGSETGAATGDEAGTTVELRGDRVSHGGVIEVSGAVGGTALLEATGTLEVSGRTLARGETGAGGDIRLLAEQVNVRSGAQTDVSGATDGGAVRVGGGWHGQERGVRNARETLVERGATLRADGGQGAERAGDGGEVVVWSDGTTRFAGRISALGGARGGNGGMAEVSGREHLYMRGLADLRAPQGRVGTLLLDPAELILCHEGAPDCDTMAAATPEVLDHVSDAEIAMLLEGASLGLIGTATIRLTDDFDLSWATTNSLSLSSTLQDIILAGSIESARGSLSLEFGRNLDFGGVRLSLSPGAVSAVGSSAPGPRTIIGPSAGAAWTLTGAGEGTLTVGAQGVSFAGVQRLQGGAGADTLTLPEGGGAGLSRAVLLTPTLGRVYAFRDGGSLGRYIDRFEGFEMLSSPHRETYLLVRPDTPGADLELSALAFAGGLSDDELGVAQAFAPGARTSHGGESLSLPNLDGFAGAVFLGGMIPEAVPEANLPRVSDSALAGAADGVEAGRLRIAGPVSAPGRLVLLAREVFLGGELAAGASSADLRQAAGSSGELSIFAVGREGLSGDIVPTPAGERRSLYAGGALIVAAGSFLRPESMVIDLESSGRLRFAQGMGESPGFHPQSRFSSGSLISAAEWRAVAALGLSGSVREFPAGLARPGEVFLPVDRALGGDGPGAGTLLEDLGRIAATDGPALTQDPGAAPEATPEATPDAAPEATMLGKLMVMDPSMVILLMDRSPMTPDGLQLLIEQIERIFAGLRALGRRSHAAADARMSNERFLRYQRIIGEYFQGLGSLFIDLSLFDDGIQLFSVVGKGLSLYLSQCEEWEGCAPPLDLKELDALIAKMERALAAAPASQVAQYERILRDYRKLREELVEYMAAEQDDTLAAVGVGAVGTPLLAQGAFAPPPSWRRQ